jgi:hypothetical protein
VKEIKRDDLTLAVVHRADEWEEGLGFLTANEEFIQAGTWRYGAGRVLKSHRHIDNKRTIDWTQEVIVVLKGAVRVDLYGDDGSRFHEETLRPGDTMVILRGYHGYEILEDDTRVLEVKNGPFTTVEADKELL